MLPITLQSHVLFVTLFVSILISLLMSPLLHRQSFSMCFVLANRVVGLERFELSPNGLKVRHAATYTTTPWTSLGLRVYLFGLTLHWDSCVISAWGFWLKVGAN